MRMNQSVPEESGLFCMSIAFFFLCTNASLPEGQVSALAHGSPPFGMRTLCIGKLHIYAVGTLCKHVAMVNDLPAFVFGNKISYVFGGTSCFASACKRRVCVRSELCVVLVAGLGLCLFAPHLTHHSKLGCGD